MSELWIGRFLITIVPWRELWIQYYPLNPGPYVFPKKDHYIALIKSPLKWGKIYPRVYAIGPLHIVYT